MRIAYTGDRQEPPDQQQLAAHFAQDHGELDRINQGRAADAAAAALVHAAEAWTGDEEVARWLRTRAEHTETIGQYDGETWP